MTALTLHWLEILSAKASRLSRESVLLVNDPQIRLISVSTSLGLPASIDCCNLSQFAGCISSFLHPAAAMMKNTRIKDSRRIAITLFAVDNGCEVIVAPVYILLKIF